MRAFEARTYELLKSAWPAVGALGDRLMQQHEINYSEARAIVSPFSAD